MESNNAETAGAQPMEPTTVMELKSTEDPISNYFDKFLFMVKFAYQKERAANSSASIDFILLNAHFFRFFAVYLVCRYVNQVSLYLPLFCVCLTPLFLLFLYFYINYAPFMFLEEDIKWITRESRLLNAISKDAAEVMDLSARMSASARQIWGSGPYPDGVTVKGLDENEVAWVDQARTTVQRATDLVATFEKQRIRRDSHTQRKCFDMIIQNFQQIGDLFLETNEVKQKMNDSLGMKKRLEINICESLERSRSNIRSLEDRPIINEHDCKGRVASAAALASSIVQRINSLIPETGEQMRSINQQLLLLHPLLKDIQGIRFESGIEKAWVEEVEKIIREADFAINNLLQRPAYPMRWLSFISSWKARRKFKGDVRCIEVGFTQLLEGKDRYGFKFIRRDSSKIVYQSPHQTIDDTIISTAVDRMHRYLDDNSALLGEVYLQVTSLCNQLERMHKLVHAAAIFEGRYNSIMAWLEQAEKIVQSAEKSVVTYMTGSSTVWINHLLKKRAVSREIDQISHTISLFLRCIKAYDVELREESSSVVGLEEDIRAVVSLLTTNNEHSSVISIVGVEGIGKTTLAKKIYSHGVVVDHFPCRAWVSVPQKSNENALVEDVAKQILRSCKIKEEEEENGNASWIDKVHDIVKEKKYLLVLDNISTMQELDTLKEKFLATSSGCKILLTTRENNVALQADSPPHKLRLRTKKECWQLFTQMVHCPQEEKIAKDILGKCGGLPLAILHVGYLMFGKDVSTAEELERVLQSIKENDKPLLEPFRRCTINSNELLPSPLFECLSYFKLFPRNSEIPARRLTALWIAEGMVKVSEPKTETCEDVADKYLSRLIDQDMIQVVERKHNGEVKTCCLPYALEKGRLLDMSSGRLTDHYDRSDQTYGLIHGESSNFPNCYRHLLSIFSFDTREGNKPGEEIGNFLRRGIAGGFFHRLQVLDLERVFRPELPNTIGKLSTLKYLGLRWTFLESVPTSIGDLLNLQTLDVKHTYLHTLPSSIWKLQKLRHLYLNQSYRSKFMHQQGGSSPKNLQTLWGVFVDKDSPLKNGLDKLINLRKLGLAFQLESSEQKALADGIVKLKYLRSLRMRSIGEMGEPSDLLCMPLSGLENLSSLYLFGKLDPSIIDHFPKNLTDLTLSASFLSQDPMPKLGKLPNLKFLCFYSNSFTGREITCSTGDFPQLVLLKLWKLEQLVDWEVEENAMQNLRELEIRSCTYLNVPSGLKHLKTLTQLKLTNMPKEFAATIVKTKGQIWDDLIDSPTIITVDWESSE